MGTGISLLNGENIGDALSNGAKGGLNGLAIGAASGMISGMRTAYKDGENPWTGEKLNNSTTASNKNSVRTEPKNLQEQLALKEAMSGRGDPIMIGKTTDPAWQGWQKMQYVHKGLDGSKITIHYWKNPQTKVLTGFKFK